MNFTLRQYTDLPLAGALAALLAASCSPRAANEPHTAPDQACRPHAHVARPVLAEPAPPPPPEAGEIWLTLSVPLSVIEREVEHYVPRTLAQEKDRPIGAPGLVTYRVTRGTPKLRASQGRLSATMPVQIDLSLCKPFGSLCIRYGSCTPAYDVKASWDVTLSAQHELPAVRLSQKVTEGCSVGVDVTEHVTRVVKDQLRDVEARIESELPPLAPWIDRAIAELTRPSMLAVGQCIAFAPTEVLLEGPVTSGERLSLGLGLSGTMNEAPCDAVPHPGRGLPVHRREQPAQSPRLELRQHVPAVALQAALEDAVARAKTPALTLTLRDQALTSSGVLLEVELGGSACGMAWVEVELGVEEDHLVIESAHVHEEGLPAARAAELEAAIRGPLALASLAPRWVSELAVEERTDILGTLLRERTQLDLHVTSPAVLTARVIMEPDGLWVLSEVDSRLGLKAQARSTR